MAACPPLSAALTHVANHLIARHSWLFGFVQLLQSRRWNKKALFAGLLSHNGFLTVLIHLQTPQIDSAMHQQRYPLYRQDVVHMSSADIVNSVGG